MGHRHTLLTFLNCIILAVLIFIPMAMLLVSAFSSTADPVPHGDLAGIRQLVILGRSLLLAVCSAGLAAVMGLLSGYAVAAQPPKLQRIMAFAMGMPLLIPPFIQALCWIMLADRFGCRVHGFGMATFVLALSFWPVAGWLAWRGFVHSQGSLVESAWLGQGRFRVFLRIRMGLIQPHLLSAFLLVALFCLADYGVPSLFRVNTYPVVVFAQFAAFYSLRGALISAWPYILLPALAVILWRGVIGPRFYESGGWRSEGTESTWGTGRAKGWAVLFGIPWSLSALLPILVLVYSAGSLNTYAAAWKTACPQLVTSLWLALAAGIGIGILAFPLAQGIQRSHGGMQSIQDFGVLFPAALPGTILGIAMIQLWNHPQTQVIYGTASIIVLLYMARFLPFAVWAQSAGLAQVREELLEAARLAPGSTFNRIRRILLPLSLPHMILGGALGFILSLHELCGTMLIAPPGTETLTVRIYSLYHYGAGSLIAALSLFLIMGALAMVFLAAGAFQWLKKY